MGVPFVELSGSNYEIGRQLGEFCRERIREFLSAPEVVRLREEVLAQPRVLSRSLRAAADRYPQYMREMSGIADGAGLSLQEVFIFNWRSRPRNMAEGCTTIIVPKRDRVLLAHNEDWLTGTNDIFLARLHYENGLEFLGVCYCGLLPGLSASINQHGLVQALNNLVSSDGRAGLPLAFVYRAALEARSIDEAVGIVTQPGRADSENFDFAQGARAVFVETTACDSETVEVTAPTVHTNHFLCERFLALEAGERLESSRARYHRARALLAEVQNPSLDDLKRILSSHHDWPLSICRHGREPHCEDTCDTLGTVLVDTAERTLRVCYGPPCRSDFEEWSI